MSDKRGSGVLDRDAGTTVAAGSAGTRGFLFSDLRGYTAFVERRGDRAAAELLVTYRDFVRAEIAAHQGAEVKTEGDSFYVVFPNASAAVEAGLAIVLKAAERSTANLPLRVGVGIHAGETVATDEGLVGGAVNIAARVCAKAEAGEVLVTDTVRALTRTFLPYRYTNLGTQQLKGVTGRISLYRVEIVPSSRSARIRRQLTARRGRIAVAAAVVVILFGAAGAMAVALGTRAPDCVTLPETTADVVAKIDPDRACPLALYSVGRRPTVLTSAGGKLWVLNSFDATITALSPDGRQLATVAVLTTGDVGSEQAVGHLASLASDSNDLWVLGQSGVTRIGLETVELLAAYQLPRLGDVVPPDVLARAPGDNGPLQRSFERWLDERGNPYGIAASPGRVWISYSGWPYVLPFDVALPVEQTGQGLGVHSTLWFDLRKEDVVAIEDYTPHNMPFGYGFAGQDVGGGLLGVVGRSLWVADRAGPDISVLELDTGAINSFIPTGASGQVTTVVTTDKDVWIGYRDGQVGHGLGDRPAAVTSAVQVAKTISGLAVGPDAIWVTSTADRAVYKLDLTSLAVEATIPTGGKAEGVAVAPDGSVWVAIRE